MSADDRSELTAFLVAWRTVELPDRQVIDALVHPDHGGPSPALGAVLARWPGLAYWSDEPDGRHLVLTRPRPRRRERWLLQAALFIATLLTTTYAGAILVGTLDPDNAFGMFAQLAPIRAWAGGLRFSLPLLAILLVHEMGHYVAARRYALDASPPYFIPLPFWPSFIGTMGAFIRLRTIVSDRRQLLDVGAAGPLAGFVVALAALAFGLTRSAPVPAALGLQGMVIWFGALPTELGDSLVTLALREFVAGGADAVTLDPIAFAGWVGLFVTMLNLLPVGQLDGGHILYAVLPLRHTRVALAVWLLLLALGLVAWLGWTVWAVLVLALSRGRLGHPPVLDVVRPLPRSRRLLAWVSLLMLALTFSPVPFRI